MSQLSEAIDAFKANGDPAAFAATLVADLGKDFQIISALPGVKAFEDWLAQQIVAQITKAGFTGTLGTLLATAILDAL